MSNRTIAITESIYKYLCDHSLREDKVLVDLRNYTFSMEERAMQIAPEQGQFMQMLCVTCMEWTLFHAALQSHGPWNAGRKEK